MKSKCSPAALLAFLAAAPLFAQDTTARALPPIVTVTRDVGRSPLDLPYAVSVTHPDSLLPGQTHTFVEQTLALLPGLTVANRTNPSQDTRVSIRGFGARSQFGIRSIRVMRDGMPLTMPDGQTAIDYLDLESVGSVETIRGTAAALYGNASGGVIDFRSEPPPTADIAVQPRLYSGSYDLFRRSVLVGGSADSGRTFFQGNIGRTTSTGYRQFAHQDLTNGFLRAGTSVAGTDIRFVGLGLDMPLAQNPGAITRAQFDTAPNSADPLSVTKDARKVVHQIQAGVSASRPLGGGNGGELFGQVYDGTRSLYNPLTFSVVRVDWHEWGGALRATLPFTTGAVAQRVSVGADAQGMNDARKNWSNCNGVAKVSAACPVLPQEEGSLTLEQRELVSSVGPYVRDELTVGGGRWNFMGGVRSDNVTFEVQDHLGTNSGKRTLSAVSPVAGVTTRLSPLSSAYATVSTAFETPTVTELGNQPTVATGFNPNLRPQYSTNYEVGIRGLAAARLQYDVAAFDTEVRDELIPYEIAGGNGKTYYLNAGRTRRRGGEISLTTDVGAVALTGTYSLSHFRFVQLVDSTGANLGGNTIPGIPEHQAQVGATWRIGHAFVAADALAKSQVFVNDANAASAPGFAVFNLRAGGTAVFGRPWFSPMVGVLNLFDRHYVGSVAINAAPPAGTPAANATAATKFYEPAAGRTLIVGFSAATSPW